MSETSNKSSAWQMSLSAMLSILSLGAAGAGVYTALEGRLTVLETTQHNADLAQMPVRLSVIETAASEAKTLSNRNNQSLNRIERLLCRSDDPVRLRECDRLHEGIGE